MSPDLILLVKIPSADSSVAQSLFPSQIRGRCTMAEIFDGIQVYYAFND